MKIEKTREGVILKIHVKLRSKERNLLRKSEQGIHQGVFNAFQTNVKISY